MSTVTKPILLDETFAEKMDTLIGLMQKSYYTLVVTVLTRDDVEVTGVTVYVRQGGADGPVYKTAAYEGQPVSFSLPQGFAYHVSVSKLAHHYNPTTASGIISDTNVSHTLYYSDMSHITSAGDIQQALDDNEDLTGLIGESITCQKSGTTLTWDVVDYDKTEGVITLLLHNALETNMQFEPPQALAYFEYGLPAGDYKFKNGSTYYYFTLETAIPADGQLRATTTAFQTFQSQSTTEILEQGTVSTTEISGATDLGTCGAETGTYPLNHMDRVNYGSNNTAESALFAWLNSDAAANVAMTPVTKFSRPYIVNQPGFLNGLDADFLATIAVTNWKCTTNSTYECPASMGGITVKGQAYTITSKFCFASEKEIFGTFTNLDVGDSLFDLYDGATAADRIKYYGTGARIWWLRTPYTSANYVRTVITSGTLSYNYANGSVGVVPACKIKKSA